MVVGSLRVLLQLYASSSLKDKRSVVQSVKRRLQNRFNVAVAELPPLEDHRRAGLGVVTVSAARDQVHAQLDEVSRFLDGDVRFEVVEHDLASY